MGSRTFIFRTIFPTIALSLFIYISHQLFRFADLPKPLLLAGVCWVLLVTGMMIALPMMFWMSEDRGEKEWHLPVHEITHFFMGYFSYLLFLTLARDILAFFLDLFGSTNFNYSGGEALLILVLPIGFMFLGFLNIQAGPFIKKVKIPFPQIADEIRGFKIAQISDLHIGPGVSVLRMQKVVQKTNSINADIIVLTGDIIDYNTIHFEDEIMELKNLKAKYGVYFIVGNHEYFWNFKKTTEAIQKTGIQHLINETNMIQYNGKTISLSGASDPMARFFSLPAPQYEKLNEESSVADFRIILCHQPNQADLVKKFLFHLQLSGHTHRGQFIPWSLMIRIFQKYTGGLFQLNQLKLYVNQGTGFWGPPDRFGTYCEITDIEIV